MPQWLKTMLLAVGLLILVAFVVEPVLVARRRRQRAAAQEAQTPQAFQRGPAGPAGGRAPLPSGGQTPPPSQGCAQGSPARSRAASCSPTTIGSS